MKSFNISRGLNLLLGAFAHTLMALVVDAVEEVVNLTEADIEPTPDFGGAVQADYILGMAKIKGQVKALLDIDAVLHGVEWKK